jgi:sulfur carrier protein ThiS
MKIKIEYSKLIKIENYASNSLIEVPGNCTVRDLLSFLKLPVRLQQTLIVHVNNAPTWNSTVLKENDSVMLYQLIGGG